mgnify:CR=1 FL=1
MIELYTASTPNGQKIHIMLEECGLAYTEHFLSLDKGDQFEPAFLKINPNGELPALVDDDLVLWESNAILVYACEKLANKAAYPDDPKIRADIHRWHLWESSKWFGACYVYLVENVVKPILDDKADPAVLEAAGPNFHKLAGILEDRLEGRQWLSSDDVTIADIAVAAPMHLHVFQKLPLENYPNLRGWMERIEALPCWKKSDVAPHLSPEILAKLM